MPFQISLLLLLSSIPLSLVFSPSCVLELVTMNWQNLTRRFVEQSMYLLTETCCKTCGCKSILNINGYMLL